MFARGDILYQQIQFNWFLWAKLFSIIMSDHGFPLPFICVRACVCACVWFRITKFERAKDSREFTEIRMGTCTCTCHVILCCI